MPKKSAKQVKKNSSNKSAPAQRVGKKGISHEPPVQKKPNLAGLPDQLKSGIENLSGYSMDDVKVHYNSPKPAQLQAHAYAQGNQIHLATGQEKHLPHEAWHIVQQKQGRVRPTMQFQSKVNINDDAGLEKEADVMGARSLSTAQRINEGSRLSSVRTHDFVVQGNFIKNWYKKAFGIKDEEDQRLLGPHYGSMQVGVDMEEAGEHLESSTAGKASTGLTIAQGAASAIGKPFEALSKLSIPSKNTDLKIASDLGGAAGIIGAVGSGVSAGLAIHKHLTGSQLAGDKHLLKFEAASSLANIGTSGISSKLAFAGGATGMGQAAFTTLGHVAAPFAGVAGAADLTTGVLGYHAAKDRERDLQGIKRNASNEIVGDIAHLGEDAQETKKKTSILKGAKGALGIAGAIALGLGSGPVGWGLLGAGALVGLGSAAYDAWRKHKHGKQALQEQRHGNIISAQELNDQLDRQSWKEKMTGTRAMRAHALVRGAAAEKLMNGIAIPDEEKRAMLNALGLKSSATGKEIAAALA